MGKGGMIEEQTPHTHALAKHSPHGAGTPTLQMGESGVAENHLAMIARGHRVGVFPLENLIEGGEKLFV